MHRSTLRISSLGRTPPPPLGAGAVRFTGLQTPPASPDADLDCQLGKLAVRDHHHYQPITATTTTPGRQQQQHAGSEGGLLLPPSPATTPDAASPPRRDPIAAAAAVPPEEEEEPEAASPEQGVEGGDPALGDGAVVGPPPAGFRFFPLLPAELRIRVWELSFEPRVVELHTRRLHYADDFRHGGQIYWHSQCANPAALSVNVEAREMALARYSVTIPLTIPPQGRRRASAADPGADAYHRLYLDPASDTVALLGELDLSLLRSLFGVVRAADPTGRGVRRLGVSAACFKHQGLLSMYAKTVFRDVDELVLFMYVWSVPPEPWSQGRCVLEDCADKDFLRRWEMTVGKHFKSPDGQWLRVGKANKEIRIMDLLFLPRGYS
ncbi:hypothetical protein RB598_005427 [Gaeumannomyces tritici]